MKRLHDDKNDNIEPNFTGTLEYKICFDTVIINIKKGKLTSKNGIIYEGDFIDGRLNGKAIIKLKSNIIYEGDVLNGKPNGKGILTLPDGTTLNGKFKDGFPVDKFIITFVNGDEYVGKYSYNTWTTGTFKFANGDIYEGHCMKGRPNGKGILKFKNGNIFSGQYINNETNNDTDGIFHKVIHEINWI